MYVIRLELTCLCMCLLLGLVSTSKFTGNVGTVLFSELDIAKKCWSREDLSLLQARKVFQDLIPALETVKIQDDMFVHVLMEYFHGIFGIAQKTVTGKAKHLVLLALADTFGGYLNFAILPLTKRAYYGGTIGYGNAKKMFDLFDELKAFLKTDGRAWSGPMTDFNNNTFNIETLNVTLGRRNETTACKGLIVYDRSEDRHVRSPNGGPEIVHEGRKTVIPMPFLDSSTTPGSIAMPFKHQSLRSLQSPSAAFIIVKYYVAGTRCLMASKASTQDQKNFASGLYTWLEREVVPHLDDDKWYPGFGGVLRVVETIKKMGIGHGIGAKGEYVLMPKIKDKVQAEPVGLPTLNKKYTDVGAASYSKSKLPWEGPENFEPIVPVNPGVTPVTYTETSSGESTTSMTLYAIIVVLFAMVLCCICAASIVVLRRLCTRRHRPCCDSYGKKQSDTCERKKSPLNTFVQIFYTPSNTEANVEPSVRYSKESMDIELVERRSIDRCMPCERMFGPTDIKSSNATCLDEKKSKSSRFSMRFKTPAREKSSKVSPSKSKSKAKSSKGSTPRKSRSYKTSCLEPTCPVNMQTVATSTMIDPQDGEYSSHTGTSGRSDNLMTDSPGLTSDENEGDINDEESVELKITPQKKSSSFKQTRPSTSGVEKHLQLK